MRMKIFLSVMIVSLCLLVGCQSDMPVASSDTTSLSSSFATESATDSSQPENKTTLDPQSKSPSSLSQNTAPQAPDTPCSSVSEEIWATFLKTQYMPVLPSISVSKVIDPMLADGFRESGFLTEGYVINPSEIISFNKISSDAVWSNASEIQRDKTILPYLVPYDDYYTVVHDKGGAEHGIVYLEPTSNTLDSFSITGGGLGVEYFLRPDFLLTDARKAALCNAGIDIGKASLYPTILSTVGTGYLVSDGKQELFIHTLPAMDSMLELDEILPISQLIDFLEIVDK